MGCDGRSRPPSGGAGPILSSFRHVNLPLAPGKAGASRRKPTAARPWTVARVVKNRTKRSDQAIALQRRAAWVRRIDGLRRMAEMVQNPLNHRPSPDRVLPAPGSPYRKICWNGRSSNPASGVALRTFPTARRKLVVAIVGKGL
jgi:hypothetical protein